MKPDYHAEEMKNEAEVVEALLQEQRRILVVAHTSEQYAQFERKLLEAREKKFGRKAAERMERAQRMRNPEHLQGYTKGRAILVLLDSWEREASPGMRSAVFFLINHREFEPLRT